MKMMIRAIALLLVMAMLLPLAACQAPAAQIDPARVYLDYLERAEYARIYGLLDPYSKTELTLAEMSDRYDAIYDAIGVTSITGEILRREAISDSRQRVYLSLVMESEKLHEPLQVGVSLEVILVQDRWYLEWTPSMILSGLEEGGRVSYITLTPSRGEIFDVNGNLLATNDHALSVYVQTDEMQDLDTVARIAAPILGMTESSIRTKVQKAMGLFESQEEEDGEEESAEASPAPDATPDPDDAEDEEEPKVIKRSVVLKAFPQDGLTEEEITALTQVAGLKIDREYLTVTRSYPYGSLAAHLIGYTGYITAEDLEKPEYAGLNSDTILGKSGLEKAYDEQLRGQQGYELAIYNAEDEKTQILAGSPAVDGQDLWLTIDLKTQQLAQTLLFQYLGTQMAGTLVVLDYKTGELEAASSHPDYDLNLFSFPLSQADQDYLYSEESNSPMFNRVTQGLYPPGSVVKPFVGGEGLEKGAITQEFAFDQSSIYRNLWKPDDQRWVYPEIRRVQYTPDPMNLRNSLIYSDNIFFAYVALQLGETQYRTLMDRIHFGQKLPFDLPVASSRISNADTFGSMKLLADSGYGQGEMVITPLQMATIFSSLANDGIAMRPYVVAARRMMEDRKYVTVDTASSETYTDQVLSDATLAILEEDLKAVVNRASYELRIMRDLSIAGKSGTAQIGASNEKEIAWFIAYNTQGEDSRLVCVTLETPANENSFRYELVIPFFEQMLAEE